MPKLNKSRSKFAIDSKFKNTKKEEKKRTTKQENTKNNLVIIV